MRLHNQGENFKSIVDNKLPNNYTNKEFVELTKEVIPKNTIQFWIMNRLHHDKLKQLNFEDLNSDIKYLSTIIKPYSYDELSKIQQDEYLRRPYKLISENKNNTVNEELIAIEQNLLLYEI